MAADGTTMDVGLPEAYHCLLGQSFILLVTGKPKGAPLIEEEPLVVGLLLALEGWQQGVPVPRNSWFVVGTGRHRHLGGIEDGGHEIDEVTERLIDSPFT